MILYHYYARSIGPFRNLSDLSQAEAESIMAMLRRHKPTAQCNLRQPEYLQDRQHYESILRQKFIEQGGIPERKAPHYMVVGPSSWLSTWFENSACICIPIEAFDLKKVSFTYGDSHPTFSPRVNDGKEYRKKLYLYHDIIKIIARYGLPQTWNDDGRYGPERYVEAHIWSDETISRYKNRETGSREDGERDDNTIPGAF